jgi:hypothetical protein
MTRDEAARLNITDSLQIRPNNDFGGMLAVMHNLHCLVSNLHTIRDLPTSRRCLLLPINFYDLHETSTACLRSSEACTSNDVHRLLLPGRD